MIWEDMTYAERRLTTLGLVLVIAAVAWWGAWKPLQERAGRLAGRLDTLQQELREAEQLLHQTRAIEQRHELARQRFSLSTEVLLPPRGRAQLWIASPIERAAQKHDVRILWSENAGDQLHQGLYLEDTPAAFIPSGLVVELESSLSGLIGLLEELEKLSPMTCVSELTITAQRDAPERHKISLVLEWPTLRHTNPYK